MTGHHREIAHAETLLDLGRPAEAERLVGDVLSADPESAPVLSLLARALLDQDRAAEAVAPARAAVQLEPESSGYLTLLAVVLAESGRPREAEAVATRAVRLAPDEWSTHYVLASAVLRDNFGRGRLPLAHRAAHRAMTLAPLEADPHNLLGVVRLRMGDDKVAKRAFQHALGIDPVHADALRNLATVQIDGSELEAGATTLTRALAHHPQDRGLHEDLDRAAASVLLQAATTAVFMTLIVGALYLTVNPSWLTGALVGAIVAVVQPGWRALKQLPPGTWRRMLPIRPAPSSRLPLWAAWVALVLISAFWVAPRPVAVSVWWLLAALTVARGLQMGMAAIRVSRPEAARASDDGR